MGNNGLYLLLTFPPAIAELNQICQRRINWSQLDYFLSHRSYTVIGGFWDE